MGAVSGNIYGEFRKAVAQNHDRVLIHQATGSGYSTCTYGKALQEIDSLAAYLAKLSLRPGAHVAILSENRYEWVVAFMASVSLGLTVVPLDPKLTPGDWANLLKHSESNLLFLSDRLAEASEGLLSSVPSLKRVILFGENPSLNASCHSYQEIVHKTLPSETIFIRPTVSEGDVASLVYTSGTTGEPKGVTVRIDHPDETGCGEICVRWTLVILPGVRYDDRPTLVEI